MVRVTLMDTREHGHMHIQMSDFIGRIIGYQFLNLIQLYKLYEHLKLIDK